MQKIQGNPDQIPLQGYPKHNFSLQRSEENIKRKMTITEEILEIMIPTNEDANNCVREREREKQTEKREQHVSET